MTSRSAPMVAAYLSISRGNGPDGQLGHYVSLFTDVTEQWIRPDEIEALALRDPLTPLPSRRLPHERLQHASAGAARGGAAATAMCGMVTILCESICLVCKPPSYSASAQTPTCGAIDPP